MSKSDHHEKIVFSLPRDEDGYPPIACEALWAVSLPDGNFRIDNIPFYVCGISSGDEVNAERNERGDLEFRRLMRPSGNSVFRLFVSDANEHAEVRARFEQLGCKLEIDRKAGLVAIEIPQHTSILPILDCLMDGKNRGAWDFEEGALRHSINNGG
jgi:hypothetical protein